YYLWHDEELEKLNAPDEAFINFHYHLKDIEYNQNDIHLYVAESSTDGVTGYLSLDGNSLDSDSIEEYLADQDWTFDQKVQFLKNLKTAVDETWDKVTNHYNEQFEAIVAQYGLSNKKEKSLEKIQEMITSNSEQQKKVENPIEDLPEQSQEAAPLPSTQEEYSLNESSPTQTQSQPLLHFTISEPEKSIYKIGYHPVNKKELNKLNRYAAQIQENANWYKNELADSNVTYFYKNNDNLEALKVTFKAEQYPHLVGIFAIDDDQSATKTLDDLASGKGDYQNIMVANRGATFSKIQVLPDFKAVVDSNSFIFDDLSEVERMNRLDLAKAIRTEDKDVLIAFRNVDGEYLPASLMKVTNKLESELSIANNKDVLGIVGEKDGEFKVLSVNEEIIKDGGEKMLSIVKNNQFENLSKAEVTAEDFTKVLDAVYNVGAQVGKDNRANIPEELYPAWDKYYEYAERYDNNFDVIVKAARADNLFDENSDFYKEVWLKKIQEENQKVKDSDGDGLTDDEEIALGTNPYSPDSDGDGILDSVEKASGTDATNPSDTPDSRKEEMAKRDLTLSEMIKAKNTAALNQHLQEGIKDYFDSDNYKNFLEGMSHFNNYSVRNIQLIKAQLPEASMVASFNEWKKRNGHVNKGEKALYVQAPVTVIKKDADGKPIINSETGEKETLTYFKPVPVFDISQVSPVKGKELNLPKMGEVIPSQITKEYYQNVYRSLRDISQKENGIPIRFRELEKSDGSYSPKTNEITIKKGMTYEQTLSTLIHEIAHSELHNKKSLTERFEGKLTRSSKELQAESIAYVVSNHLGFDTSNDSFAYLASWSKEPDGLENLKAQLEIVQEEASSLMKRIDKHLEKYQNLTVSKDEKLTENQKRELEKTANPFYQSLQKAKGETVQTASAKEEQSKKVNRPMKQ
ncbi:PBECR4 domain-containing protein, partial [Streptococcus macedonicus]